MSSPSLGQSGESLGSPRHTPSASQYPFPSYDLAQKPSSSGRYGVSRDSTTGSITSIGGVLDSSTQNPNLSIAEAGNNGKHSSFACHMAYIAHMLNAQQFRPCYNHLLFALVFFPIQAVRRRTRPRLQEIFPR